MTPLDYTCPLTLEEALRLLGDAGCRSVPLAGGTDLLVARRVEPPDYDRYVDVSRIPQLKKVEIREGRLFLGAALTFTQASLDPLLNRHVPFLVQACLNVGSPQIRNRGTLGGNVCNAAACADSLPALVCLDAAAHLRSLGGERSLPVCELVLGPHKTALQPGELLTHFSFPVPPSHVRSHFIKIGRRAAQSISRLSIAVMGGVGSDGRVDFIHICPGAATPRTTRFDQAEAALLGQSPTGELIVQAGKLVAAQMIEVTGRRWSTEYKELAIQAITERALRAVFPV